MQIIWLGHSSFRIEIGAAVLLVDPWLTGNPMFPAEQRWAALAGVTHILLTHGHGDHAAEAGPLAAKLKVPLVGIYPSLAYLGQKHEVETIGFSKGGTVALGGATVTMVNASHSSSFAWPEGPISAGSAAGYMIEGEGHVIYLSGDTDVMADMEGMGDLHRPDIGILAAGGHYKMDMARAAYAARRYFNFRTVIPCHYRCFLNLARDASFLTSGLPGGGGDQAPTHGAHCFSMKKAAQYLRRPDFFSGN